MKLKNLLIVLPGIMTISPISAPLCAAATPSKLPIIHNAEIRKIPFYKVTIEPDSGLVSYLESSPAVEMAHFNGSSIGYFPISSFINNSSQSYFAKSSNNVTTITNKTNGATAKIDFRSQTITYTDFDLFKNIYSDFPTPLTAGCAGGSYYFKSVEVKQYVPGKEYIIDLSKYNIVGYFYKDEGYLPYELMPNIFDIDLSTTGQYNGKGIYEISTGNDKRLLSLLTQIKKEGNIFNDEFMEYTYNLLALTLDFRFGVVERASRSEPGKIIKYFPNGAYEMLAPYHDRLVSMDDNVSNEALKDVFTKELDDGGHARYSSLNVFSTQCFAQQSNYGKETSHTFDVLNRMDQARKAAKYDVASYWKSQNNELDVKDADSYYTEYTKDGKDPIAYITFDSFQSEKWSTYDSDEYRANRELPSNTNKNNYWSDTIRLTMWANEQIKQHNVKNLVIDLTHNGGGTVYAEQFIASWLCGGVTQKMCNPKTGAFCEFTVKADVNGDGNFDENDYLANDVNLYLITSSGSFSCGNMLPCNVNDNKPNATIIGEKSGGGCCFVDDNLYSGTGSLLRSSSIYHSLRGVSTPNNHITNDTGCDVQIHLDESHPEQFFDRANINKTIWSK